MASTADIAFYYALAVTDFTNLGFTNVSTITPTTTRWGIQGDRGGKTSGLIYLTNAPVDAEFFYKTLAAAGFHEDLGLIAGHERQP